MKLVDILAVELKVWPESAVTAVQDLDGEVKFDHSHEMPRINKSKDVWIRQGDQGDSLYPQELAEDCSYTIVTRSQWQAAVDAISAPNGEPWNGEGLPPVGTMCEWKEKTGFSWVQATVLFITDSSVVMQREDGFEWQMLTKRTVFRPLPNPEQIAADKRLNSAMALYGAVMDSSGILFERLPLDRQEHYLKLVDEGWQQVKS